MCVQTYYDFVIKIIFFDAEILKFKKTRYKLKKKFIVTSLKHYQSKGF